MPSTILDPEDELLSIGSSQAYPGDEPDHADRTAPVFTKEALDVLGEDVLPQRALYGSILAQRATGLPETLEPSKAKLYVNTNSPFSGVVCGVQGSGKSHSTAVLLESCLIKDRRIGTLPAPLTGLVFHYDTAAGGGAVQPCEAAHLASLDSIRGGSATPPQVTVLVVPNNVFKMQRAYSVLPSVTVAPLHFAPEDISGDRLLAMMKVDTDSQMPLYMEAIMGILRAMDEFDYDLFRDQLKEQSKSFSPNQKSMMNLRLSILDSFLKDGNTGNKVSSYFKPGHLTIVDLSSPFMDATTACSFFDIILGLFVEHRPATRSTTDPPPKLIVLDEAHKYLTDGGAPSRLTESLLSIIRQQRHQNMRVLISTQEPTVIPTKFLALCSFMIAHRFSSPGWFKHLAKHISAADGLTDYWASKVMLLRTGEAMVFAPAGLAIVTQENDADSRARPVTPLGSGYFLVRSRLRITQDGGQSVMAVAEETMDGEDVAASVPGPLNQSSASATTTDSPSTMSSSPGSLDEERFGDRTTHASSFLSSADNGSAHMSSATAADTTTVPSEALLTSAVHASSSDHSPRSSSPASSSDSVLEPPAQWRGLVHCLRKLHQDGWTEVHPTQVGQHRRVHPVFYSALPVKMKDLVSLAQEEGIVVTGGTGDKAWMRLTGLYVGPSTRSASPSTSLASSTSLSSSESTQSVMDSRFIGLLAFLRERKLAGEDRVRWAQIGAHRAANRALYPTDIEKLSSLMVLAEESGVVTCGKPGPGQEWAKLVV